MVATSSFFASYSRGICSLCILHISIRSGTFSHTDQQFLTTETILGLFHHSLGRSEKWKVIHRKRAEMVAGRPRKGHTSGGDRYRLARPGPLNSTSGSSWGSVKEEATRSGSSIRCPFQQSSVIGISQSAGTFALAMLSRCVKVDQRGLAT